MTISIGRFGLDTTIDDPMTLAVSGRTLRLTGRFKAATLEAAKALRQQLTGYVDNPDELWVPVVVGHDGSLTGFYRVVDASVTPDPGLSYISPAFASEWSATLEQVSGYAKPLLETIITGALRTNVSAITAANMIAFTLLPQGALPVSTGLAGEFRTASDGTTAFLTLTNPTLPITYQFMVDPTEPVAADDSGWFQSCAALESQALDGATYRTVVGRQIPYRTNVAYPGHDWRLSNGFVRVAPAVITGAANSGCDITVSHWDGTQWDTAIRYTFTLAAQAFVSTAGFLQIAVLRNDPAAVSIRLGSGTTTLPGLILDLTLRRGSRNVECRWSLATAGVVIVARSVVEAATALTGGIRATANDASGNRYVLAAAQTTTNDLVNGKITSNSVTAYDFMIGSEIAGSGAAGLSAAQSQIYQWICAQSETYRLAGR